MPLLFTSLTLFCCSLNWYIVSAKGFNKSQPVTEFVCETLGLRDLEDRRIKIDREKLKKAISGNCCFCMNNFTLTSHS